MSGRSAASAVKIRASSAAPTLQRKCACGRSASSLIGDCPDCQREKTLKVQKKARAGRTDGPLEHEADRMAEQAIHGSVRPLVANALPPLRASGTSTAGSRTLQRKCACGSSHAESSGTCAKCAAEKVRTALQPKLRVNEPGDAYEREADQVAQDMMGNASQPTPKEPPRGDSRVPAESELSQGGEPLPAPVARFYEPRFGRSFSSVRIHSGDAAAQYNEAVNAYAFTYGNHIWLGAGLGRQPSHILAHELAHVVQQTQPPALPSSPGLAAGLASATPGVQRYEPYWIPAEFVRKSPTASKKVGSPTHGFVLPKIGSVNHIYTEAPVPNADKTKGGYLDVKGIADLYAASTTVGVYFDNEGLPRELASNPDLKYAGKPLEPYGHINKSAPRADESRQSVIGTANAPTSIAVGDLKPSHGTAEAEEGPQQLKNYMEGFQLAHEHVNRLDVGSGGFGQTDAKWTSPLTTNVLKVEIPDEFKAETGGQGQKSQALIQVQNGREINPRPRDKRPFGKVYVSHSPGESNKGILNYVWEPDAPPTPAVPKDVSDMRGEVETKIVDPLRQSPVQRKERKPVRPADASPARPLLIQKQPRDDAPKDVKDPFDKAAFEKWQADHGDLTKREKALEKTPSFDTAESLALAIQDRQAAIRSGFKFPPISTAGAVAAKTVDKIRFWTGFSSAIFGRLRYAFGGLFVKVVNAYHSIRARFQGALKDTQGTPKKSGLIGTVVRIAFEVIKLAGRFLITRTSKELVGSLKTRVLTYLESLIPEDKIEEFEAKVKELTDFATELEHSAVQTVEDFVKKTVGPYLGYVETIMDVAEKLGEITSIIDKVKWGARVIACLSPPGWGCLWILAQSVLEKFASWLIDTCWFKKDIAPLITAREFIKGLPKKLADFIIDGIRGFLPPKVSDILADKDADQISTDVPDGEICDKNDFPPTGRDRALLEKLALQDLRKDIGEEKWDAWTKLAERYGINRADFLSEQEVLELKRELLKASVPALREALELYPALAGTPKDVVNLTNFLERAEEVKQQMAGAGGGQAAGEGGGEGISVSASKESKPGQFKPVHGFRIVAGVGRGQFQGDIIKVDRAATIKGVTVTLENIEVRIANRLQLHGPERMVFELESTKDQYFDVASKYGADVVNKIGYVRFEVKRGIKFKYTLPLTGDSPASNRPPAQAPSGGAVQARP